MTKPLSFADKLWLKEKLANVDQVAAVARGKKVFVFVGNSGLGKTKLVEALVGRSIEQKGGAKAGSLGSQTEVPNVVDLGDGTIIADMPGANESGGARYDAANASTVKFLPVKTLTLRKHCSILKLFNSYIPIVTTGTHRNSFAYYNLPLSA